MLETKNLQRNITIRIIIWIIASVVGGVGLLFFSFANFYATGKGADTPEIFLGIPLGGILMFFSFSILVLENMFNRNPRQEKPYLLTIKYLGVGLITLILITIILFILSLKIGGHLGFLQISLT